MQQQAKQGLLQPGQGCGESVTHDASCIRYLCADDASDEEGDADRVDQQMGDVGDAAEDVDERLWNGDEEEDGGKNKVRALSCWRCPCSPGTCMCFSWHCTWVSCAGC